MLSTESGTSCKRPSNAASRSFLATFLHLAWFGAVKMDASAASWLAVNAHPSCSFGDALQLSRRSRL